MSCTACGAGNHHDCGRRTPTPTWCYTSVCCCARAAHLVSVLGGEVTCSCGWRVRASLWATRIAWAHVAAPAKSPAEIAAFVGDEGVVVW
jgi:hypothetical protein